MKNLIFIPLALMLLLVSCNRLRPIQTSTSPDNDGEYFRGLDIIGFSKYQVSTDNQSNAQNPLVRIERINIPIGTDAIIPSVEGWLFGFGMLQPTGQTDGELSGYRPLVQAKKLALGQFHVFVDRIYPANLSASPPIQQADIKIIAYLVDENVSQPWFGKVDYHLIFLRNSTP